MSPCQPQSVSCGPAWTNRALIPGSPLIAAWRRARISSPALMAGPRHTSMKVGVGEDREADRDRHWHESCIVYLIRMKVVAAIYWHNWACVCSRVQSEQGLWQHLPHSWRAEGVLSSLWWATLHKCTQSILSVILQQQTGAWRDESHQTDIVSHWSRINHFLCLILWKS